MRLDLQFKKLALLVRSKVPMSQKRVTDWISQLGEGWEQATVDDLDTSVESLFKDGKFLDLDDKGVVQTKRRGYEAFSYTRYESNDDVRWFVTDLKENEKAYALAVFRLDKHFGDKIIKQEEMANYIYRLRNRLKKINSVYIGEFLWNPHKRLNPYILQKHDDLIIEVMEHPSWFPLFIECGSGRCVLNEKGSVRLTLHLEGNEVGLNDIVNIEDFEILTLESRVGRHIWSVVATKQKMAFIKNCQFDSRTIVCSVPGEACRYEKDNVELLLKRVYVG